MTDNGSEKVDLIVVGAGSAALSTAIAAKQLGVGRIVMLEKAPEPEFGGNPRFSHSGFRWVQSGKEEIRQFLPHLDDETWAKMEFRPYTEDDFHGHIGRATRGKMKPELQEALVSDSNSAVHWLREVGVAWEPDTGNMEVGGKIYFEPGYSVHPRGGGLGQLESLRETAIGMGIEIRYESAVSALLGTRYKLDGIRVLTPEREYEMTAPVTVLCAGGFQANRAARARYLGPNADLMKVRGSRHNTGEVLEMTLALGAAPSGHWQMGHSSVVDANSPDFGVLNTKFNRYSYMFGITVNSRGQRFVDEGSNLRMLTYARMGWITLAEPDGIAYQIFDQKIVGDEGEGNAVFRRKAYSQAPEVFEANSIAELAEKIGLTPEVLEHTVLEFNAACDDSVPFRPNQRDGKATMGLKVPKSNWAIRIDEPPFVAYPVTAGITFTFGGLEVNASSQVLNTGGQPIDGLYAVGDIVGLFYHGYVGSTGQTRNVVFARRAAGHAFG